MDVNIDIIDNADITSVCTRPYQISITSPDITDVSKLLGADDLMAKAESYIRNNPHENGFVMSVLMLAFLWPMNLAAKGLSYLCGAISQAIGSTNPCIGDYIRRSTFIKIANLLLAGGLDKFVKEHEYSANFDCPVGIPTASEAASAWLGNTIDTCTFEAYCKSNDVRFQPFLAVAKAGKFKLSAIELVQLEMRGGIIRGTIGDRLRELGSLEDADYEEIRTLASPIPGPSDIIRFMVRDTANQKVVDTFGLDTGFTDNFNGQLAEWAQQQGVITDIMKYEWRAHWSIPSPTQLYEILHKLRHNPKYGGPEKVESWVNEALIQQDILPFWIPKLVDVAYHPINRTDADRAFGRGMIDDKDYLDYMYRNGYNDTDAQSLLQFAKAQRQHEIVYSTWGRSYIQGYASKEQVLEIAHSLGYGPATDDVILESLGPERQIDTQRRIVEGIALQYKRCVISTKEYYEACEQAGIPQEVADHYQAITEPRSSCGTRRMRTTQLAQALQDGIISKDDYYEQMRESKYPDATIDAYFQLARIASDRKAQAAKAKAEAAEKRAEQQQQRQQQQAQQRAQRQLSRAETAAAKIERSRQTRNKVLLGAAEIGIKNGSLAPDSAARDIDTIWSMLMSEYGLSQNESAFATAKAAALVKGGTAVDLANAARQIADAASDEPWTLYPTAEGTGPGIT